MPTLVIRLPDGSERTHELSAAAPEAVVGRLDGSDLVLTEGGVSRKHARFFLDGATVVVEDLGSANGTFVDGQKIEGPTPVTARAQVVIGDYEISVKAAAAKGKSGAKPVQVGGAAAGEPPRRTGGGTAGSTATMQPVKAARATKQLPTVKKTNGAAGGAGAAGPGGAGAGAGALAKRPAPARAPGAATAGGGTGPILRGITGPWANKTYPLRGKVVVGRVAGVNIQLEDESVSRRHAELEKTADGIVVRDLGSANGTTVNGEPVEGDILIQPGDIVSFGMIELSFEAGDEEALAAPTRRGGGSGARAAAGASRRGGGGDGDGGGKKKLIIVAAAVGVLLMVGVVVKFSGGKPAVKPVDPGTGGTDMPMDVSGQVESLLSECRSYSSAELGSAPNWKRAMEACKKAQELDPINQQVISQMQKINLEIECQKHFEAGQKDMDLLREEQALDEFGQINEKCTYYRAVKPTARQAIDAVKKRAKEDCLSYARGDHWDLALGRCEKYMIFACQNMSEEEMTPPVGYTVDPWGKQRKNSWKPKDPQFLNLLKAMAKADPSTPPKWTCPPMKMFGDDIVIDPGTEELKNLIKNKFKEPLLQQAFQLYWDGKTQEATVKLQKIRLAPEKAELHQQADDLRADMGAVENLYKAGSTALQDSDFDKAAEIFKEALDLDEKLSKMVGSTKITFYRRTIQNDMAKSAYQGGRVWAEREDPRRACKIWRLAFGFYRGDAELNKAIGFCSQKGGTKLANASTCEDLDEVLDFATDGDGLKEKVLAKKTELNCPAQ